MSWRSTDISSIRESGEVAPYLATMRHVSLRLWPLVAISLALGCQSSACQSEPRRLDFAPLASADRIEVVGRGNTVVARITDREQIDLARAFIERYPDGWIEVLTGPKAPWIDFQFYGGETFVGEFGMSANYIIVGGLHQRVPESETASVAKRLGLKWPQ
jgi:hypothetical protein